MGRKEDSMQLITKKLTEIRPYERNPRRNDGAVDAVAESIKQCGYIAPIIIDEDGVILAGHTRYKALKQLGKTEAECIVREGLTEEQKRKYRILDNKTGEFAGWDYDLLEWELEGLDFEGFDFNLMPVGEADLAGLFEDAPPKEEKEPKKIQCPHCGEWFDAE